MKSQNLLSGKNISADHLLKILSNMLNVKVPVKNAQAKCGSWSDSS